MKIIIVEDEVTSQLLLRHIITENFPMANIVGVADSVDTAIAEIEKNKPDLVYLDIQIKGGTSFDVLNHFTEKNFEVIFITAYDHYAISAIKQKAFDYILKPIRLEELINSTNNVINQILQNKNNTETKYINISSNNNFEILKTEDILYFRADGSYTEIIHLLGKSLSSKNIGEYENQLKSTNQFFRTHHSFLVNKLQIKKIEKKRSGSIILINSDTVPVSQRKMKDFLNFIGK